MSNISTRKTSLFVPKQTHFGNINFVVPPIWLYILERKFTSLLETGVHFVNIVKEMGSSLPLLTPTLAAFSIFFRSKPTLYLVIFQTYTDDINFIVPPIWPYILERKFTALLETGVPFVFVFTRE